MVELILQEVARGSRVMATAASNIAVDNLVERLVLASPRLRVVRMGHPARLSPSVGAGQDQGQILTLWQQVWRKKPSCGDFWGLEMRWPQQLCLKLLLDTVNIRQSWGVKKQNGLTGVSASDLQVQQGSLQSEHVNAMCIDCGQKCNASHLHSALG